MASWKGHLSFGAHAASYVLLHRVSRFRAVAIRASVRRNSCSRCPPPDLDSDTSKPVKVLFRAFSIIASGAVGMALYLLQFPAVHYLVTGPFITLMAVQLIILPLFNHYPLIEECSTLPAAAYPDYFAGGFACCLCNRANVLSITRNRCGIFIAFGFGPVGKSYTGGTVFRPANKQGGPLKLYNKISYLAGSHTCYFSCSFGKTLTLSKLFFD